MATERYRQTSFLKKLPDPTEVYVSLRGERTTLDVLTADFEATVNEIRRIYLPHFSYLDRFDGILAEALRTVDKVGDLYDTQLSDNPDMNLEIAANLETLRKRQIFLDQIKSESIHPRVVQRVKTPEWEKEIRASTDGHYYKLRLIGPTARVKVQVPWTGATTHAYWQISTIFNSTPSTDLADRIRGEDWLSSILFEYYFSFLRKKELIV